MTARQPFTENELHDLAIPALNILEICTGVGMLGEGLRAALQHLGITHRAVGYMEREAYPAAVLAARCQEGSLDDAPVWSDLLTFDGAAFHGAVDGIAAGFPCQDLSLAGKRAGLDGKRSGLFFDILDIADDSGAWFLFLENVAGIASATASVVDEAEGALEERAAARVVGELADRGWNAEWLTLSASDVGASHGRERWFCFAWRALDDAAMPRCDGAGQRAATDIEGGQCLLGAGCPNCEGDGLDGELADAQRCGDERRREPGDMACTGSETESEAWERQRCGPSADGCSGSVADASSPGQQGRELGRALHGNWGGQEAHGPVEQLCRPFFAPGPADPAWAGIIQQWPERAPALEPGFHGMADGMAFAMDESRPQRLKCCGNGVVALGAAVAFVQLARRAGFTGVAAC